MSLSCRKVALIYRRLSFIIINYVICTSIIGLLLLLIFSVNRKLTGFQLIQTSLPKDHQVKQLQWVPEKLYRILQTNPVNAISQLK